MKIAIVSDACDPPTNGVSHTLRNLKEWLGILGHEVMLISPPLFRFTLPCPTQPDIRLVVLPNRLSSMLDRFAPEAVHIATEGPLGLAARRYCVRHGFPFTTMFTTKFPEVIHARFRIPTRWTYAAERWFHHQSSALMVATESLQTELAALGFRKLRPWTRGVDTELFRPRPKTFLDLPRPIFLYVGRVAVEKNIECFLDLELSGTKLVVGDGPQLPILKKRYPDVVFAGTQRGEDLRLYYAASDVFVFPSVTDTFGLVILEALASGIPVAAHPVTGPLDIIADSGAGILDEDLGRAARMALSIPAERCRAHAMMYSWERCARQFLDLLHPIREPAQKRVDSRDSRRQAIS